MKLSLSLFRSFLTLWLGVGLAPARAIAAPAPLLQADPAATPLSRVLNPDGTLQTSARGSFNVVGYTMETTRDGRPTFRPVGTHHALGVGDDKWATGFNVPGVNGTVSALAIDGSGSVYAGGNFTTAGGVATNYIAKWNGTSWSALGAGMNVTNTSSVYALAVDGSGNVYAGGNFDLTTAGGMVTNYIAKWNGTTWSALGSGLDNHVLALAVDRSGNVYAGGNFTTAGGRAANYIAKWNGTNWSALGAGVSGGNTAPVEALAVDGSGSVYAGGVFTTAGGVAATNIAKWNGTSWSALGTGMNSDVHVLAVDRSGNVYAGGRFSRAGGAAANYIAKWNGTNWSALGAGVNAPLYPDPVYALAVDGSGSVYAGGNLSQAGGSTAAGGVVASRIAKWNGTSWSALGAGMSGGSPIVYALAVNASGNVYAGGIFTTTGGVTATNIGKWNGTSWSTLGVGNGMNDDVKALAVDGNGNVCAGGNFTTAGGTAATKIAKWNGTSWSALGAGLDGVVNALAVDGSGNVYVGGYFTRAGGAAAAGGVAARYIAKWNGTSWSALGAGMNSDVNALAVDGSGNVYAGGLFTTAGGAAARYIAKWNGTSWSALGVGMDSDVKALAVDGSGNVYAGGDFTTAGGVAATKIAKWNGTNWSALGAGMNSSVYALVRDGSGNVYAGGFFTTAGGVAANRVAKWNGTSWSALGTGVSGGNILVRALAVDGSGNVYVGGGGITTAGGVAATNIAKWNGSSWNALGTGVNLYGVSGLAVQGGYLYAGGGFSGVGDNSKVMNFFGRYTLAAGPTAAVTSHHGDELLLYPNPAHNTATVRLLVGNKKIPLFLLDALGREVRRYSAPAGTEATLDLRGLPAGVYVLRSGSSSQRLVIE